MPVIGNIKLCADKPVQDVTLPNDVKVHRAEWGDVQQSRTSSRAVDPLLIEAEGLQAGMALLFINCDDPKIRALVAAGQIAKLKPESVKVFDLKDEDLGGRQTLTFSDKMAMGLGLQRGCEFAILQRDRAGNISKNATLIELKNDGTTIENFSLAAAQAQMGDTAISMPAYQIRVNGYTHTVNEYRFVRGPDTTAATTYAEDIKLSLDTASGKVTMQGDKAVTGKSTMVLKNLHTQKEFKVGADAEGNFELKDIDLAPGARFKVWSIDRNRVQELVMDGVFDPKVCGAACGGEGQGPVQQGGKPHEIQASQAGTQAA